MIKSQVMRPTFFGANIVEWFDRFCSTKIIVYTEIDKYLANYFILH